jgi:hypothetical protein
MKIDLINKQERKILSDHSWISVGQTIIERNQLVIKPEIITEINNSRGTFTKRNIATNEISEVSFFSAQFSYTKFGD